MIWNEAFKIEIMAHGESPHYLTVGTLVVSVLVVTAIVCIKGDPNFFEDSSTNFLSHSSGRVEYQTVKLVEENLNRDTNITKRLKPLNDEVSFKILDQQTSEQTTIKEVKSPLVVYPKSSLQTDNTKTCILQNNKTSYTLHKDSDFWMANIGDDPDYTKGSTSNCLIRVEKVVPSICKFSLKFHEFDYGQRNGELLQAINRDTALGEEVSDQLCKDGGLLLETEDGKEHKICGNLTGQLMEFPFYNDIIDVRLFSTQWIPNFAPFFNITMRQIDCPEIDLYTNEVEDITNLLLRAHLGGSRRTVERDSLPDCNEIVDKEEFILQSPNYPSKYPNDIDCTTIVYPSSRMICALGRVILSILVKLNFT